MRLLYCILAAALASTPFVAAAAPTACAAPLRLNEILAGPARDWDASGAFSSRDDEWVELVNTAAGPITLDGYFITDGDSIPRYALTGTLGAGEHLLVTGRQSWDWERANGQPAFGLSLGNSGDAVILWQIAGGDTLEAERYAFRSHEAAADRSAGRSPDGTGEWVVFDNLNPYTGSTLPTGNGCAPSPGSSNACGTVPALRTTWGEVKSIYR